MSASTLTLRFTILFPAITLLALIISCCGRVSELNNPRMPTRTSGWHKVQLSANTIVYGDFVVRTGESVNDGQYGIEVVNLYSAKCSLADRPGEDIPSAELRFFKVSDNSTICDSTFKRGSATLDETIVKNPKDMIWSAVEINEVNTKSGWVKFNLRLK
jgi:hypothetical protein